MYQPFEDPKDLYLNRSDLPEKFEDAGWNSAREKYEGVPTPHDAPLDYCALCEYPEAECTCIE